MDTFRPIRATWSLSLDCECPKCEEDVDLLADGHFFQDRDMDACENSTDRSRNVEVTCPDCGHEFTVDLEY